MDHQEELRLGVVGYSSPKFDADEARSLIDRAYDAVARDYPEHRVTVVSGLTNLGVPKIAYEAATERGWRTAGVACAKAHRYECFPVDERQIVGTDWGDESPAFLATIHALLRVGGGNQARTETHQAKQFGMPVLEYDLPASGR